MKWTLRIALFGAVLASAVCALAETHELKLTRSNLNWDYYDADFKPVLKIASGDTVRVETIVAPGLNELRRAGVPEAEIPASLKEADDLAPHSGHPLTGPIYVQGAEPGDTLEVHILSFELLHPYAITMFVPRMGTLPEEFPYVRYKLIRVNTATGTAEFRPGITLKLAPFWGSMGVAPPAGKISTVPPGPHAGNLDNKQLVAGSTLYIPVYTPGALLSVGDGHAMQGDGEVTLMALETSLRGTMQIFVRKGKPLRWPRAETPTHFITMGLHPDLNEAARLATREMIDFLVSEKGLSRDEAYMLCSLAVDLHVTQLVDGTKGIHAMLPKALFH